MPCECFEFEIENWYSGYRHPDGGILWGMKELGSSENYVGGWVGKKMEGDGMEVT